MPSRSIRYNYQTNSVWQFLFVPHFVCYVFITFQIPKFSSFCYLLLALSIFLISWIINIVIPLNYLHRLNITKSCVFLNTAVYSIVPPQTDCPTSNRDYFMYENSSMEPNLIKNNKNETHFKIRSIKTFDYFVN